MLVASHLSWMRDLNYIDFNRLHVIGFSLGAHIAGFIGKNTNRSIHTIVGLDPASLFFSERLKMFF
jgi:dienelactone hydrolase